MGYQLATRTGSYNEEAGLDTLSKYADLYGLTDKSGVEIGEYAPDVSTKDPVRSAIGQGSNSYTTVGLARYVTTIANSGTCYNLTLLDKTTDSQGNLLKEYHAEVRNQIDLPQEYWDAFHLGMRQVVENKKYFSDLAVNVASPAFVNTNVVLWASTVGTTFLFFCVMSSIFTCSRSIIVFDEKNLSHARIDSFENILFSVFTKSPHFSYFS